ncbi:hypothetical protein [Streptomyces pacificus]|uniref:Uncharacterized protein n=1 Tax=Streptomyces pacificus TaxID=2705029 RepID=A0A6A0AS02_9ACTN|nr:hypothetical protein [Streptomyces pacificus]GFH34347.1 hypothetical protein SCWH03_05610 [Streptomyces pacificus]
MTNRALPHTPYITAVETALTQAALTPQQADAFVEDSYDVPHLRGVITITPETCDIPADRWPHGLLLAWDWHTGRDDDYYDRGPVWQWARLNGDGSSRSLEPLPVPGWVAPAMLAAVAATLAYTGKLAPMGSLWHDDLRTPVETAIEQWAADEEKAS